MTSTVERPTSLRRFTYLSIAAAVVTIGLKAGAYWLTGSVGLLSDALESFVNLAAALMALWMLIISERPPDEEHSFGHTKAEYFSSGVEGALIIIAAAMIAWSAIDRLLNPQPLDNVGIGLVVALVASAINFGVARVLLQAGKRYHSILLEADAKHLMTDVWTSVGVVVGVGLVALTGWLPLDSLVALAVAVNIVWSGLHLVSRSASGLLDTAIPAEDREKITRVLDGYGGDQIEFHSLRTRQSGPRRFISMHVLVPGTWTVQHGHDVLENIEREIRASFDTPTTVFTHLEPLEDPASMADIGIDRRE
ncbi:MAG: cation diffusion facilitator family transporter [Caldilineaceae bacterium]